MLTNHLASAIEFDKLDWKLGKALKNMIIKVAKVEGSNFKAFNAVSTYDVAIEEMVAAITDFKKFTTWLEGAEEVTVIKKIDQHSTACYLVHHVPWPYRNRDAVFVQTVERMSELKVIIKVNLLNSLVPEKEGLVRMTHLEGIWTLENVSDNKTKVTYQMHIDPAGEVPHSLVNLMLTGIPKNTLNKLHKVDFRKYSDVTPPLI
ncbi:MAG: hypothetical protein COA99_09045 [Moraxellaceae bacterium]|nr:MAG: hypothetical protein COA99_09045 [Moraxellaceae bacterium]